MRTKAAITTTSALPAGEPKIVRLMSPICRVKLKWVVSPSDAVPEISVALSITVPGTLTCFDRAG